MRLARAIFICSLFLLPAIVVAQDIKTDFDKAFDFSTVKTYSIKIGTPWGNDLSQRRVLTEFTDEIAGKGWKKVAEGQADVQVLIHGATQKKHDVTTFYSGGGYGYRYGGMGSAQTMVNEYMVGTLVVDMFDAKSKNLVFRGSAEDELSDNPEKNAKKLEKASAKMFKNFPPSPKKGD